MSNLVAQPWAGRWTAALLLVILISGGALRSVGLDRGIHGAVSFHPDVAKQVDMVWDYLAGNPVRYRGSWFYDGYPYGLNVVDAALIRIVDAAVLPWRTWIDPASDAAPARTVEDVHRAMLRIRVAHGVLTIGLVFLAVRLFGGGRAAALAAAALCAVSPLGLVVTHSATGDIGVDLFLAAAMCAIAGYARTGGTRWIAVCGFACGCAFACKYQGLLGLWLAGVSVLLACVAPGRSARRLAAQGGAAFAGCLAGALALTPGFFVNANRAWKDMRTNFARIQSYNAPEGFDALPLGDRLAHGLGGNLPAMASALGWGLVVLALAFAVLVAFRFARERSRGAAVLVAVATFPFAALLASTALKPAVQPFHFSYLVPILAVAAGLLASSIRARPARAAVILGLLAAAIESGVAARSETFFWRRDEINLYAARLAATVFESPAGVSRKERSGRVLKSFYVEPARVSVFRNRQHVVLHPEAALLRDLHPLPFPTVAWPNPASWIVVDGPAFPLNDREFLVPASGRKRPYRVGNVVGEGGPATMRFTYAERGAWMNRDVVLREQPKRLRVGVRTGRWPSRVHVELGGMRQSAWLGPHAERILEFESPRVAHAVEATEAEPPSWIVAGRVRAQIGPAWMTILHGNDERDMYVAFGPAWSGTPGRPTEPVAAMAWDDRMQPLIEALRFLGSTQAVTVGASPRALLPDGVPLAAGHYRIVMDVINPGAPTTLELEHLDPYGHPTAVAPRAVLVPTGSSRVTNDFWKTFAPYDANLVVRADPHPLMIAAWALKPSWGGPPPPASAPQARAETWGLARHPVDVSIRGVGVWRSVALPDAVRAGETIRYATVWELDPAIRHKVFHDGVVFLHVRDAEGRMVATLDHPLPEAAFSPEHVAPRAWQVPADLAPGDYAVFGGVYDSITLRRFDVDAAGRETRNRAVRVATLRVTAAGRAAASAASP